MLKIFGNFIEMGDTSEYLIISFSPGSLPLSDRWRNNSLSADFLANYWGTFFPVHDGVSMRHQREMTDAVNYIVNELLENAMKFSYGRKDKAIQIGLYLSHQELRFYVSNTIQHDTVEPFQRYIQQLLTEDAGELYLRQLERNAADEGGHQSRLGFLTILYDYRAELAWKFETITQGAEEVMVVTTMVQLAIERSSDETDYRRGSDGSEG